MLIHGVDFTSAPGRRKSSTIASGTLKGRRLAVTGIEDIESWPAFEAWLERPGPWIGGFDFPFGLRDGDKTRTALEAYPGFAVRQLSDGERPGSYKNDAKEKQTPEQRKLRSRIVRRLVAEGLPDGIRLHAGRSLLDSLVADGSGDRLDAVLCALQAAQSWTLRGKNFGLPAELDPLEGWIATVPAHPRP